MPLTKLSSMRVSAFDSRRRGAAAGPPFLGFFRMKTDRLMSWTCAGRHPVRTRIEVLRLLLVALCGCGLALGAAAGEQDPVRIALTREATAAPFYVAVAAGFFRAEGLDPEVTFAKTDPAVYTVVASGKADIGMASLSAAFYSYAASHGLKIIASRSSDQTGFPIYALLISRKAQTAGFSGVRGLAHARIGIAGSNSGTYYALFSIALRFGLDAGSIKTISLKTASEELRALSRDDVDAVVLPFATALQSASKGRRLLPLSDLTQWQQGVIFTSAKNIAANRVLIERFMRAYQRGTADYQLNFLHYDDGGDFIPGPNYDRYLDAISREVEIPPAMLAITKSYCDRRANLDVADIAKQVHFWQDQSRLDKHIVAADLLDLSFIGEENIAP